jgi:trimethylamine:corrinoid methyltransferase-like protein
MSQMIATRSAGAAQDTPRQRRLDRNQFSNYAGPESMMALLTTVNCGVDFMLHAGGILSAYLAFSYEVRAG